MKLSFKISNSNWFLLFFVHEQVDSSVENEIKAWDKITTRPRSCDPLKAMAELKQNFPHINLVFRKFSVFPATQSADESLLHGWKKH